MFTQDALTKEMGNLRRFAMRLTRDTADADDLLQSTLLRAMDNQHLFETGTNLFRWCSKIMFNLFVSSYRRRVKFETQFDPEPYLNKESVEPNQELLTEMTEVSDAMAQLTAEHRDVLIMICVKGMSYAEVSESLQIPVGTVRSRLSRARCQLQALLDPSARLLARPSEEEMPQDSTSIASAATQRWAA